MMRREQARLLMVGCIGLAALLRLMCLGTNPPALFRDEAEKGYTAWSLARTGGYTELDFTVTPPRPVFHHFPLFIQTPGSLTSAIYHYADAPFVGLLGLSEWTIRLPAALAGIATVWLCYLLALALCEDRRIAVLAAALLAVSPWHVLFSRWAAQGIFVPLFLTAGFWLLWHRGRRQRERHLWREWLPGALLLALAAYAYAPARLTVPLLALVWAACRWGDLKRFRQPAAAAGGLFGILALALIVFQLTTGSERLGYVTVAEGGGLGRWALTILRNYFSHFTPAYLFMDGDQQLRHSLPGFGIMLHIEMPFFLAGVLLALVRRRSRDWFLIAWLLIAPLPAALTRDCPHALRSIAGLPAPSLLSAIGFFWLWDSFVRRERRFAETIGKRLTPVRIRRAGQAVAAVAALNIVALLYAMFFSYPTLSAPDWQYGVREAFALIDARTAPDDPDTPPPAIYMSAGILFAHYLALTYRQTPPEMFREHGLDALKPVQFMVSPQALPTYYRAAPSGAWFILTPIDLGYLPVMAVTEAEIRYPGLDEGAGIESVACILARKP